MKKSFGQHFLREESAVKKVINAADLSEYDFVIEVGPGDGVLTREIAKQVKDLILIEADKDLIQDLKSEFSKVEIIKADAAKVNFDEIVKDRDWKFISNLPYNSANAILMNILTSKNPPKSSVVMVQKEVGEKILANAGEMSLLSVAVQMYVNVKRICIVKPGCFVPAPKVDSVVLRLESDQKYKDPESVIKLAKAGFSSRRKQLHRNLADANISSSDQIKSALSKIKLSEKARAQELSIVQWIRLYELLKNKC